jgi:hypothetical protein
MRREARIKAFQLNMNNATPPNMERNHEERGNPADWLCECPISFEDAHA